MHCFLYASITAFDGCSFVIKLEIRKCESSNVFVFLFQDCFGHSGLLELPYEFYNKLVKLYKEVSWNFVGDGIDSVGQFVFSDGEP